MKIRPFETADEAAVVALWEICGLISPKNDPHKDVIRKLAVNPEWFLVGTVEDRVVASCMAGYEGHRGWINYLAVHPYFQRKGHARELLREAEHLLKNAGCPKVNLQIRSSNSAVVLFYESIGYLTDDVVSMGKRLVVDERTEEDS